MKTPKTPAAFDYDLWTTEDGRYMVRIKATGEVTEVQRTVMQLLRTEEKRLRRGSRIPQDPDLGNSSRPTILSLDVLPEDIASSQWMLDPKDYAEEISTQALEDVLRESLTPIQFSVYQACILNGSLYEEYSNENTWLFTNPYAINKITKKDFRSVTCWVNRPMRFEPPISN